MKWLAAAILCIVFSYGIMVGKYEVFPYKLIASLKQFSGAKMENSLVNAQFSKDLSTTHVDFRRKVYNFLNTSDLYGWGGGIAKYNDALFGVDMIGNFFMYEKGGIVRRLDNISLSTNRSEVLAFLNSQNLDQLTLNRKMNTFRFLDIVSHVKDDQYTFYVSYHYYDIEKKVKSIYVAKLTVFSNIPLNDQTIEPEIVYTSDAPIPLSHHSQFFSNRNGGRMQILNDNELALALGDNNYDGFDNERRISQEDTSDYGKLILIDLNTYNSRIIAKGLRNPQGLLLTSEGTLLESEHGPQGGDELNVLFSDGNYGWPNVTYGLNYNDNKWPLQIDQGRHESYIKPVFAWLPSIAPSNMIQASYPTEWNGDLILGTLKEQTLYRLRLTEGRLVFSEEISVGERIRDLEQLNDGTIVLWTDNARFHGVRTSIT